MKQVNMEIQEEKQEPKKWSPKIAGIILQYIIAYSITTILVLFAGFREIGLDPDSPNYASIIQSIDFSNFTSLNSTIIEPSFYLIAFIAHLLFNDAIRGTFVIYALLGVTLKMVGIYRLSHIPLLSVIFYLCYYYPLHELTQIRVGVASAIFLLAIPDIANQNRKAYIIKAILATLFHSQAIIMLPLYPILNLKTSKWFYFILPIFGLSFSFVNKSILDFIIANMSILNFVPSFLSHKIILSIDSIQKGVLSDINIFNLYYLSLLGIYYFCLINIKRFKSDVDVILIKILGLSVFTFPFFSFLPVFAFRISEFLGIVIMILLASIVLIFKQKKIIIITILIYSLIALYKTLFSTALFKF
jgi:hypothetical protein